MRDLEDQALHEFDQFIREWIGPIPAFILWRDGRSAAERVRLAIRRLAAAKDATRAYRQRQQRMKHGSD